MRKRKERRQDQGAPISQSAFLVHLLLFFFPFFSGNGKKGVKRQKDRNKRKTGDGDGMWINFAFDFGSAKKEG